jgi:hypothetical protein
MRYAIDIAPLGEREATGRSGPFDVAVFGRTDRADSGAVAAFADAGATWWLESLSPMRGTVEGLLEVVEEGPPGSR